MPLNFVISLYICNLQTWYQTFSRFAKFNNALKVLRVPTFFQLSLYFSTFHTNPSFLNICEMSWHKPCRFYRLMNLNDFIIIYLACGSPVGVWFYFNHKNSENVLPNSFLVFFFWIFFIARFFYKKFQTPDKTEIIRRFQKEIEKFLPETISIFEFREISNRYIGLTLAEQSENLSTRENAFSARFNSQNKEISAICLQRRNRQKLKLHQICSRKDFLQTISEISEQIDQPIEFLMLNIKFVNNLNDIEAENLITEYLQIHNDKAVNQGEQELWNNAQLNLPKTERTNFHLPASTRQTIPMTTKD